jgi:hypothetical protein
MVAEVKPYLPHGLQLELSFQGQLLHGTSQPLILQSPPDQSRVVGLLQQEGGSSHSYNARDGTERPLFSQQLWDRSE